MAQEANVNCVRNVLVQREEIVINPTTLISKTPTIFYVLVGTGVFVSYITKVTSQ